MAQLLVPHGGVHHILIELSGYKKCSASLQAVPAVLKFVPGGSAILGFLVAGAAIGPYGLGLIMDTEPVKHLAEIGVIFLLFNLGLELSLERLIALARQVRTLRTTGALQWYARLSIRARFCACVACLPRACRRCPA